MKVIAYDIGTTGLKTCLFHISDTDSVQLGRLTLAPPE